MKIITKGINTIPKGVVVAITIFSSTGCIRCSIVKKYLEDNDISFTEYDIKIDDGNEKFKAFYKVNRQNVLRDNTGIFFPIVQDGGTIVQDAGASLDWLINKRALSASILPNNLGHGWIGKINISLVPHQYADSFFEILTRLKQGGLKIAAECTGENSILLERILTAKLVDKLSFNIDVASFIKKDEAYIQSFQRSVYVTDNYHHSTKVKFFIDVALQNQKVSPSVFEEIAKTMKDSCNNNRLPVFLTNTSNIDANLYAYRQSMGEWQILTELKTRLY